MESATKGRSDGVWFLLTIAAAIAGGALVLDASRATSATYDESAYLRIGCRWWLTGDQEQITRMGSPLTFWKVQQAPVLWFHDRPALRHVLEAPERYQASFLPRLRAGAAWIFVAALLLTAGWSRMLHGPRAMALAAWIFALSPNLVAHGSLITMEMPIVATTAAIGLLWTIHMRKGCRLAFVGAAIVAGLAFSCKFTAILIPPIAGLCLLIHELAVRKTSRLVGLVRVAARMVVFLAIMVAADLVLTGFATLPLSERTGEHPSLGSSSGLARWALEVPIPQDWVGFATQVRHQRSGGPSYLLGERRMTGWWWYYLVAMACKVPPAFWLLVGCRLALGRRGDSLLVAALLAFLAITVAGSSRNYGVRYLLPVAPLAIVWVSALAEGGRWSRIMALVGVTGYAIALAGTHPRELSYFPWFAGGAEGGRHILADSNLDWGQGLRDLERLQRGHPELSDLTLYYFGDTRPEYYGVGGTIHVVDASTVHPGLPARFDPGTRFVGVSASLQFGPWGAAGYFARLSGVRPRWLLPDATIAIYEVSDLPGAGEAGQ